MSSTEFKRLDKSIVPAKKIEGIISLCVYAVIILVLFYCTFKWDWVKWIFVIAVCAAIFSIPFELYLIPKWKYHSWRYSISETSIQIHKGILFNQKILIPMGKIQHVDAKQGPIFKKYNLYSIILSTAAGSHEIPGLAEETAEAIRKNIEIYARLDDEQV